jgi:hypothetical protein
MPIPTEVRKYGSTKFRRNTGPTEFRETIPVIRRRAPDTVQTRANLGRADFTTGFKKS